tara:strand:- start:233 stop:436 length:204 start_codon:yes stop_codon:yes gene_type:complete
MIDLVWLRGFENLYSEAYYAKLKVDAINEFYKIYEIFLYLSVLIFIEFSIHIKLIISFNINSSHYFK